MTYANFHAEKRTHEAAELARMLITVAENCEDADFAHLRMNHISILHMLLEKLEQTEMALEATHEAVRALQ